MAQDFTSIVLPWPEWKIVSRLGKGAYGSVYKAVRHQNEKAIYSAIKIIQIPADEEECTLLENTGISAKHYFSQVVSDIENEIFLMQDLRSASNVVNIEDFQIVEKTEGDLFGWTIYIRMELLTDLQHSIQNMSMDLSDVIKIGCDLCSALEICHKEHIIHRDIKPGNIFVTKYGDYKLGDFGVSKHTEHTMNAFSTTTGTISYMAPEVSRRMTYDYTVDIYSLGLVLYQLANCGRLPFYPPAGTRVTPADIEHALTYRMSGTPFPDPVNGTPALGNILRKACNINPGERYSSATQFKAALKALLSPAPDTRINVHSAPPVDYQTPNPVPQRAYSEPPPRSPKKKRSMLPFIIAGGVAAIGVVGVGAGFAWSMLSSSDKSYEVVVNNGSGDGQYKSDSEVNVTADTPDTGYEFDHWEVTGEGVSIDISQSSLSFHQPEGNITLTAIYKAVDYHLLVSELGIDTLYHYGDEVSVSAVEKDGKSFSSWKVLSGDTGLSDSDLANTSIQFSMPAQDVELVAEYSDITVDLYIPDNHKIHYNGHTYAILNYRDAGAKDWSAIVKFCEQNKGYPVTISDIEENEAIISLAYKADEYYMVIGYNDDDHDGVWEWEHGDSSFVYWGEDQPTDKLSENFPDGRYIGEFMKMNEPSYEGRWCNTAINSHCTRWVVCEWDFIF